jgi:hypothetical protein
MGATYPDQYMLFDFIVPTDQCLVKTGPTYYDAIPLRIFCKPSHSLQIRPATSIRTKFSRHPLTADAIHGPSVHVPFFQFVQRMQKTSNTSPSLITNKSNANSKSTAWWLHNLHPV